MDYEKYWTRPDKNLLHEVLEKTINLDYLTNSIIRDYFDLEVKFDKNNNVTNLDEINNFGKFIFMEMGAVTKLNLLKEIRKRLAESEKIEIEDFDRKFIRIYEIRNIFAHSPIPKNKSKVWLATPEEISWEELHKEHKDLCDEIIPILMSDH